MTTTMTSSPRPPSRPIRQLPIIRITRDFAATPAQLLRAHTDPELFARWVGPRQPADHGSSDWDARTGGSWRYVAGRDGEEFGFRGMLPRGPAGPDRADLHLRGRCRTGVALETLRSRTSATAAPGCTRSRWCDSFEGRDAWLRSGMETGVNEGYAKLDELLADGTSSRVTSPAERHRAARRRRSPTGSPAPATGTRRRRCRAGGARDVVAHLIELVAGLPRRRAGIELAAAARRSTEDPVAAWQAHAAAVQALLDGPGHRRPAASATRMLGEHAARRRRSTGSTRPTSSCTPGTWPAPPARTTGSTRSSAPSCWPGWSRSRSCSGRRASTAPACRFAGRRPAGPACSASSAATRPGPRLRPVDRSDRLTTRAVRVDNHRRGQEYEAAGSGRVPAHRNSGNSVSGTTRSHRRVSEYQHGLTRAPLTDNLRRGARSSTSSSGSK